MSVCVIDWLQGIERNAERNRVKAYINEFIETHIEVEEVKSLSQLVKEEYRWNLSDNTANPDDDTLRSMKFRARNNYIVDTVLCITEDSTAWFNYKEANKWHDRVNNVYLVDFGNYQEPKFERLEHFEEQFRIDFNGDFDEDDIQNELWFEAFGLEFSAPPILRQRINDITDRTPRPAEERRLAKLQNDKHVTKTHSNPEAFLQQERCVYTAKEKEIATTTRKFFLNKLDSGEMSESDILMPNYIICPNKEEERHPTKIRYYKEIGCCECDVCGYKYNSTEETTEETAIYKYITTGYIY